MSEPLSRGQRVEQHVDEVVRSLQRGYRRDDATAAAALARLRRGVGTRPASDVELYGLMLGDAVTPLHATPPSRDEPTAEEEAAFAAVTLYAVHQQSKRDDSMHHRGFGFGRSARLLGRRSGSRDAVRARFAALGTAVSWEETLHHARGLVQQFRQQGIPLDYGRFARDLFDLRQTRSADRVRLAWGRDFYRASVPEDDGDDAASASAAGD